MTLSVRKCLFALGIAGFSLSAAPIFADPMVVDAKTLVTAPNWVLGSTWYYSDGYALKVTSITPASTVFDRLDAPGQWFSRQGFLPKDLTSGTATRTSIFRTIPDQAGLSLHAASPLTFQREYLENGTLMVHASSWSVEGRETITVPAGTFDCWVIVWRSRSLHSDWTGFERWWYSPQAQNYVRMEYKYGSDAEGSRVLMRYQIGAGTDAVKNTGTLQTASDATLPGSAAKTSMAKPGALPPAVILPQAVSAAPAMAAPVPPPANPAPATIMSTNLPTPSDPIPAPAPAVHPPVAAKRAPVRPAAPARTTPAAKIISADADQTSAKQPGVWHAQIMASQEEAAARKSLDKILHSHGEILRDVPRGIAAVRISGKGVFYRAWLGRFDSAAKAVALCSTLKAGGVTCSVSKSERGDDKRVSLSKL